MIILTDYGECSMPFTNLLNFTDEQIKWVCDQIDRWYEEWHSSLVNFETKTHRLDFAKEILKDRLFAKKCEKCNFNIPFNDEELCLSCIYERDDSP